MKIKLKRYLSLFCVILMIISILVDGLSTTVQATINSSQNLTNNSDNIEVYSTSNITVYNDRNNNGWYYLTEDGVKKTVYCYQHDRTQPSVYGTSGYSKVDYFSTTVDAPNSPATKQMIATVLYLGFPSNATGLKERWNIDDSKANYFTQQTIWDLIEGNLIDYIKDDEYDFDLHYYAENASSPYLGKYGETGVVEFSGDTNFQKSENTYKTGIITIDGSYTGSFSFNSLPEGIKVYNADTDKEIVGNLTTGMKIYFVYTGNTMDGSEISLSYKYQTTEIYYLIANNKSNQDLVGLDTKDNEGNLTLTLPKDETQISYTVIKKWNDSNNSDKVRPESIQVQLKADNKNYGQPITLNETNNWTYTWDNLPEKSSGNTIQYSIEELGDLSNYNVVYENKLQETIITNNLTIDIPVVKTWVGDKKESVVVRLLADGAEVNSVELTEKTNWQHTFSDLPKYNQNTGAEINYSIKEDAVDGYNSVITGSSEVGFTVTNTITGKTSVGVTKEWIGPAANSVTINLLADGIIVDSQVLNEKNNWQYTFTNLEKYKDGQEIKYTIEEVSIDGYSSVISGDSTNGFIVTNTNTEAIDIPVIKNWVGAAKESVVVRLLADGTEVNSVELTEKTNWQHTFSDLPKYNQNTGAEINYSIKEDAVDGYNSVITGSSEVGFTVTNTITGKTSVGVTKEWIGPAANSVTINLLADGIIVDSQVLNEKNNWQYTFTNLEKYKDGQEIKYTIEEVSIDGYSSVISGDSTNGFIVTNTNTETIDIPVIKNWVGAAKESVVVRLLADGTEVNSVELTEKTNWQHTFSDLPKYNQNTGAEINYSIKEDAVDGYNSVITGSSESGFTVTNTKISGKLEITKTDVADGTLLPNAGFRVYDENKSVIVEGYTNEQGVATFELGYGKYYYQEFDAPEGYLIDETLFPFEIKADGEIVKAEMTNKKIEVSIDENDKTDEEDAPNNDIVNNESNNNGENITNNTENNENITVNTLPQTGGINSIIYSILGLIISLAGVKLFNYKYEK